MSKPKLQPCPFCGVDAELRRIPEKHVILVDTYGKCARCNYGVQSSPRMITEHARIEVRCTQSWCHASISLPEHAGSEASVVETWNKRYGKKQN